MINIVCTSKPADGLLYYSYEHCCYLNSIGIDSKLIIITHHNFSINNYIDTIKEKYNIFENVIFDTYNPSSKDISLIMGRSMLTLAYLNKSNYTNNQLLTLRLLFSNKLISVYSENHILEYPIALKYFNPKEIYNLCDKEVYPNGEGDHFEKTINFNIYNPIKDEIIHEYLFLGTNDLYYNEILKQLSKHPKYLKSYGILTYNKKNVKIEYNNISVPITNLLGKFKSYVYTKPNFDPAPRLIKEFQWLGKTVEYVRDKNIKDGGMVYWNRPIPTTKIYENNLKVLVNLIKSI